jgi:hypothetical protein
MEPTWKTDMCQVGRDLSEITQGILYYYTSEGRCDTFLGEHMRECPQCRATLPRSLQVEYSPDATN